MSGTDRSSPIWRPVALALVMTLAAGSAAGQWQWVDSTGSRVFSDTPPPAGTPEKNILKRPGPARAATVETAAPAAAAPAAATKPAAQDKELQARKKQAEEAEQAQKKAEQAKLAKARVENCERATRAKATLDSGIRIATTNAKGEREIMDDGGRASEAKRLDDIIRSDCGPMPAVQ